MNYLGEGQSSTALPLYGETFSSSFALQASSRKSSIRSREIRDWLNTNLRMYSIEVSLQFTLWLTHTHETQRQEFPYEYRYVHFLIYFLCHAQDFKQNHHLSRVLQDLGIRISNKLLVPVGRGTPRCRARGPSCLWYYRLVFLQSIKFQN